MRSEIENGTNESEVDAALRMLTNAPAPEGLEERVHARVRSRQHEFAQRRSSKTNYLRRTLLFALPMAVAALVIAAVVMHRTAPASEQQPTQVAAQRELPVVVERSTPLTVEQVARVPHASAKGTLRTGFTGQGHPRSETEIQETPSFPGSAAQPTEQERLLVAMARRADVASRPETAALLVSERFVGHGLEQSAWNTSETASE